MKKAIVILFTLLGVSIHLSLAQKPPLDFKAIDSWPGIKNYIKITNDGHYIAYCIDNQPKGSTTVYLQSLTGANWQEVLLGVSYQSLSFSQDSKCAVYRLSGDTICIQRLGTNAKQLLPGVSRFEFLASGKLIYQTKAPMTLVIRDLNSFKMQKYPGVSSYTVSPNVDQLLVQSRNPGDSLQILSLLDIKTGIQSIIWKGSNLATPVFDNDGKQLAFTSFGRNFAGNEIWLYRQGMDTAQMIINAKSDGVSHGLSIDGVRCFNAAGDRLFFYLQRNTEENIQPARPGSPDVWNYKDNQVLPELEANHNFQDNGILTETCLRENISHDSKIVCTKGNVLTTLNSLSSSISNYLIYEDHDYSGIQEVRIRSKDPTPRLFRVNLDNASEMVVHLPISYSWNETNFYFNISPDGKWLLFFNRKEGAWYSYDIENDSVQNLTKSIHASFYDPGQFVYPGPEYAVPAGDIAGWMDGERAVLIYDSYDIWKIDPSGKVAPINLTNSYGRKHKIELRIVETLDGKDGMVNVPENARLLLSAFDPATKESGFFKLDMSSIHDPEKLLFGPYNYYNNTIRNFGYQFLPVKAKNSDTWIIGRCSAKEAPNFFVTSDFKNLKQLTDFHPQQNYNWMSSELVNWTTTDGTPSQGILYKPENFDPTKKYPIIFYFRAYVSNALNDFLPAEYAIGQIDVAWYVSHGYLVFRGDIFQTVGKKGESVVNSVVSSADYLTRTKPYIDSTKMGVSGSSFGGWEVNYLITRSHKFAAANECCGMSDLVMDYNTVINGHDEKADFYWPDFGYYAMGATLWQRPDLYIKNSPIFNADKITTPLLILHNKEDMGVTFSQGIELFTALWELHKPAWLLQYDGNGHGVGGPAAIDYTTRQMQFFDHYLKGAPAPKWMTDGIPPWMKGIEDGLELEPGKTP